MNDDAHAHDKPHVPDRMKPALDLLLQGESEKRIALRLLKSRYTVHDYVKAIYKIFGVSTRAELLVKLLQRKRQVRFAYAVSCPYCGTQMTATKRKPVPSRRKDLPRLIHGAGI